MNQQSAATVAEITRRSQYGAIFHAVRAPKTHVFPPFLIMIDKHWNRRNNCIAIITFVEFKLEVK